MRCGGDRIWPHCKSETKFMDYFTKSETFNFQWTFTYAGNKLYLQRKRKSLLITNINHNLGGSVAEGTVLNPHVTFNIDRIKYYNICKLLKDSK